MMAFLINDVTQTFVFQCPKWESSTKFMLKREYINLCFAIYTLLGWEKIFGLRNITL